MYIALLLIFLILLILPFRGFQKWEDFTLSSTQYLKIFLTLVILWHHIPPMGVSILDRFAGGIGRYGVSAYFFLSGYGLMKGLSTQGAKRYLDGFFKKRFTKLLIPFCIAFCCYAVYKYETLSISLFIFNWQTGENLISYAYFVEELCILYLLFFISFRFFSIRVGLIISWIIAFLLMFIYICLDFNNHWWISTLGFPMGLTLALVKTPSKKATMANLAGVFISILACYKIARYYTISDPEIARFNFALFMTPASCLFCYLVLPTIKTKLIAPSSWIVNTSYEIYLLQGLCIGYFVLNFGVNEISMLGMFITLIIAAYVARTLAAFIDKRFIR